MATQKKTVAEPVNEGHATITEAMRFLGLCRSSIYKLMDDGQISYAKFGSARRIPRAALKEYVARCTVPATATV